METQSTTPGAPVTLGKSMESVSFILSFIVWFRNQYLVLCYCPSTELSLGIPWGLLKQEGGLQIQLG